jgi:hypothetical protein
MNLHLTFSNNHFISRKNFNGVLVISGIFIMIEYYINEQLKKIKRESHTFEILLPESHSGWSLTKKLNYKETIKLNIHKEKINTEDKNPLER